MTNINPIYNCLTNPYSDLTVLNSSAEELVSTKRAVVDFSKRSSEDRTGPTYRDWKKIAEKIICFPFPFRIGFIVSCILERLTMAIVNPAQSTLIKSFIGCDVKESDKLRKSVASTLEQQNYIVRHVILEKNGVRYSGLLIGHTETIRNGRWLLHATGNRGLIENLAEDLAQLCYKKDDFNVLLINGPGVARSEGWANPHTIGDAQEIGLSFLEKAINATEIVISGHSLGGAAIGQAILQHAFDTEKRKYTVIFDKTFDRLSNIARCLVGGWASYLIKKLGLEMDTVAASEILKEKQIEQIILQGGTAISPSTKIRPERFANDGVICKESCLASTLNEEKVPDTHRSYLSIKRMHGDVANPLYIRNKARTAQNNWLRFFERVNKQLKRENQCPPNVDTREWFEKNQEQITKITDLDLSQCELTKLPPEIKFFTNLETLNLSKNRLKSLPSEIKSLTKLKTLDLCHNEIQQLPREISAFTQLEKLYASHNKISRIPAEIRFNTQLKTLNLYHNEITCIPSEIKFLTQLERLFLSRNKISQIPFEIQFLTKLKKLFLRHNNIYFIPPEIKFLSLLKNLYLDHNIISYIPIEIRFLTLLEKLSLSHNRISSIPSEIKFLSQLKNLYLDHNIISYIPIEIRFPTLLEKLSLGHNRKSSIPPEIKTLTKLKTLDFCHNEIQQLPAEISALTQVAIKNKLYKLIDKILREIPTVTIGSIRKFHSP